MGSVTNSAIIQRIDDRLEDCMKEIQSLKRLRNTHIPIAKLPSEILGQIFVDVVIAVRRSVRRPPVHWPSLMLVCIHWREVAVSTPEVWSCWDFNFRHLLSWIDLFKDRSKLAPLDVHLMREGISIQQIFRDPIIQSRIRFLQIDGSWTVLKEFFSLFIDHPRVLNIQTLDIGITYLSHTPISFQAVNSSFQAVNSFLSHDFPQLSQLTINNCGFRWDSPALMSSSLTHLTIKSHTAKPTLGQLLAIFQKHQNLESIRLDEAIPASVNSQLHCPLLISLSQLKSLSLVGSIIDCMGILKSLSFPVPCKLSLKMHGKDSDHVYLFPVIYDHYQGQKRIRDFLDRSGIWPHLHLYVSSSAWTIRLDLPNGFTLEDDDACNFFHIKLSWLTRILPDALLSILAALPLTDVKILTIAPIMWSKLAWRTIFDLFQEVEVLQNGVGPSLERIIDSLRPEPEAVVESVVSETFLIEECPATSSNPRRLSCPGQLPLPRLIRWRFTECTALNKKSLCECLELRKSQGFPLDILELPESMPIDTDMRERFADAVLHLETTEFPEDGNSRFDHTY